MANDRQIDISLLLLGSSFVVQCGIFWHWLHYRFFFLFSHRHQHEHIEFPVPINYNALFCSPLAYVSRMYLLTRVYRCFDKHDIESDPRGNYTNLF